MQNHSKFSQQFTRFFQHPGAWWQRYRSRLSKGPNFWPSLVSHRLVVLCYPGAAKQIAVTRWWIWTTTCDNATWKWLHMTCERNLFICSLLLVLGWCTNLSNTNGEKTCSFLNLFLLRRQGSFLLKPCRGCSWTEATNPKRNPSQTSIDKYTIHWQKRAKSFNAKVINLTSILCTTSKSAQN